MKKCQNSSKWIWRTESVNGRLKNTLPGVYYDPKYYMKETIERKARDGMNWIMSMFMRLVNEKEMEEFGYF